MTNPEAEKIPKSSESSREAVPAAPEAPKTPEELKEAELRGIEERIADLAPRTQSADAVATLKAGLEELYKSETDSIQSQLEISLSDESLMLIHKNVVDDRVAAENGKLAELSALEARKAAWGGIPELDAKTETGDKPGLREPAQLERTAEDVERVMGHLTPEERAALTDEQRQALGITSEGGSDDVDDEEAVLNLNGSGGVARSEAPISSSGPTQSIEELTKTSADKGKSGKTVVDKIGSGLGTLIDHL